MNPKVQTISKSVWGPKAWHLLHAMSIFPISEIPFDQKHDYYLFYKTFYYIIPCRICKLHYKDMFDLIEPLKEDEITRKKLKIWVWKIHNRVNQRLGKKRVEYKKAMELQKKIENQDIFYFINHVFFNLDAANCCISDFDHIYHFFYIFAKLYPDTSIQKKIFQLVSSEEYSQISSPREFKKWYLKTYKSWQS